MDKETFTNKVIPQFVNQVGTMKDDEFSTALGKLTSQAKTLGASDDGVNTLSSQLMNARLEKSNPSKGVVQGVVRGLTNLPNQLITDAAVGAENVSGMGLSTLGGFVGKFFPKVGAAIKNEGDLEQQTVGQVNTNGLNLGYLGNIRPTGGEAFTQVGLGTKAPIDATAQAGLEESGNLLQALSTVAGPEVGLAKIATGLGIGQGVKEIGQGKDLGKASTDAIETGISTFLIGGAAELGGNAAAHYLGMGANKFIRSSVGSSVMENLGKLKEQSQSVFEALQANPDNKSLLTGLKSINDAMTKLKVGAYSMIDAFTTAGRRDYFNAGTTISGAPKAPVTFTPGETPSYKPEMAEEVGNIGASAIGEKRAQYNQIYNTENTINPEGPLKTMTEVGAKMGLDDKGGDLLAGGDYQKFAGKLAEKTGLDLKGETNLAPEVQASRNAFVNWQSNLRSALKDSPNTKVLQGYLNGVPENIKGPYADYVKEIQTAIRGEVKTSAEAAGLGDVYKNLGETTLSTSENYTGNKVKQTILGTSQDQLERDFALGKVKATDPEMEAIIPHLSEEVKGKFVTGVTNTLEKEVNTLESRFAGTSKEIDGLKDAQKTLNQYVDNYAGTDLLPSDKQTAYLAKMDEINQKIKTLEGKSQPSLFGYEDQAALESAFVNKKIDMSDPANIAQFKNLPPEIQQDIQHAFYNRVVSQAKSKVDTYLSNGQVSSQFDPQKGFKAASTFVQGIIDKYAGTELLPTGLHAELEGYNSFLGNDGRTPYTAPDSTATGEMLNKPVAETTSQTTGEMLNKSQMSANASEGLTKALTSGKSSLVAKEYGKLDSTESKAALMGDLSETDQKTVGLGVMNEKLLSKSLNFKGLAEANTRDDLTSNLNGIVDTYRELKSDSVLWEKGFTEKQRTVMQKAMDTIETLDSIKGVKYKKALIDIATSPVIAAAGHPIMSAGMLIHAAEHIVENIGSNTGKISPSEMALYDKIMASNGTNTVGYKIFKAVRGLVENPNFNEIARGVGKAAGLTEAGKKSQ